MKPIIDPVRTITISKERSRYRIVTDDPENWHLVANQFIPAGEPILLDESDFHEEVGGVDHVNVRLKESNEVKLVYTAISAVPGDASGVPSALEIPWCFMNHSCSPNTIDRWQAGAGDDLKHATTTAIRDIAKGEELTYDYNLEHFEYASPFECTCGEPNCRGRISGFRGLSRDAQTRLFAQASPFVQKLARRDSVFSPGPTTTRGRHLIIDYWHCNIDSLKNDRQLVAALTRAAYAAGATIISTHFHRFENQGVTAVLILADSHISIHTWPEAGYAGVDIYTCGHGDPLLGHPVLLEALSAQKAQVMELTRGDSSSSRSITPVSEGRTATPEMLNEAIWFFEDTVPGRRYGNVKHGFRISETLIRQKTRFQECIIFENPVYGRVLVLDGIVQLSTSDEHIYHEMLVHPPMVTHPDPKHVCIVGGGDGGSLREVLKHNPEQVVMIDIDEEFVRIAARHLPSLSDGAFDDPRVTLLFEDASQALLRYEQAFDVIIVDCNDAMGPSEVLFEDPFYATLGKALKADGVCSFQAGSMLDPEFLVQMRKRIEGPIGPSAGFRVTLPCYHCGDYFFLVAVKQGNARGPDVPTLAGRMELRGVSTSYWTPAIHHASRTLPPNLLIGPNNQP